MNQLIRQLTPSSRWGVQPGRRLLALMLSAMLVFGSVAPGFAIAGESDSEGEGTTPPIEVPVGPPDFDPGGEETGLEEESPDSGGEEEAAGVETEAEVEIETPVPAEVTGSAPEATIETPPPSPAPAPEPPLATAPEPELQKVDEPSREPVANQSINAPKSPRQDREPAAASAEGGEALPPVEPEAAPTAPPQQVAVPPRGGGGIGSEQLEPGSLAGRATYVVRPGDCLWHIAAAALPAGSDTLAIEDKVNELWRMNEARIGTGDPNLIYSGIELRLS